MSEPDPMRELVAERLMQRLRSYAHGLGLDAAAAREIIERVITDMPDADDIDRQAEVRHQMLSAAR